MPSLVGKSTQEGVAGVSGESTLFNGVLGVSTANGHSGVAGVHDEGAGNGVYGRSKNGMGVVGYSSAVGHAGVTGVNDEGQGAGVYGRSRTNEGVRGESTGFNGVLGQSTAPGHAGVAGVSVGSEPGNGVYGRSDNGGSGIWGHGHSPTGIGVVGVSDGSGAGVSGSSAGFNGVLGQSTAAGHAGVAGVSNGPEPGNGVYGRSDNGGSGVWGHSPAGNGVSGVSDRGIGVFGRGARLAAMFDGDVEVTGDIRLRNADCAEDFDIAGTEMVEPGTVMVLDDDGGLRPSDHAYDKRVAGIVSGAGDYRPGIVLDKQPAKGNRSPIALLGKVFCKVDANYAPVETGDLLTTSSTPGHGMKATDGVKAFGAVIGKALKPLPAGQALIPVLVCLQ